MNKFSHEEGLTLIELLITLAVIAIVFAIAVPVFSNVLAGAQSSADAAQAAALSSFAAEYATTDLAFANGKTTATLNGVVIASIKGDATGGSAPVVAEYVFDTTGLTLASGANNSAVWTPATPLLYTWGSEYAYQPLDSTGVLHPSWSKFLSDNTVEMYDDGLTEASMTLSGLYQAQ